MGRTKNPDPQVPRQEAAEQETEEKRPLQYAVTAELGLNLRQGPGLDFPIVAVLPCGVGVFDNRYIQNGWMKVSTGRLSGWVDAEYLEPLWA